MPDHVPSAIAIITNDRLQLHSSLIRWGCISPLKHSKKKYMKWHCKGHIVHLNVNIYWIKKLHYTNADMKLFTYKPVESSIAMLKSFSTCNEWKPIVNIVLYQVYNKYVMLTWASPYSFSLAMKCLAHNGLTGSPVGDAVLGLFPKAFLVLLLTGVFCRLFSADLNFW